MRTVHLSWNYDEGDDPVSELVRSVHLAYRPDKDADIPTVAPAMIVGRN